MVNEVAIPWKASLCAIIGLLNPITFDIPYDNCGSMYHGNIKGKDINI